MFDGLKEILNFIRTAIGMFAGIIVFLFIIWFIIAVPHS